MSGQVKTKKRWCGVTFTNPPDADWGGDPATRRSVSAGALLRSGHCLEEWTKKQQVVSLSSAESELGGLGVQSVAKDLGIECWFTQHLDASATMGLVNRRGLGRAKDVDMQYLWIQEASKSGRLVTKKLYTNVNPADLMSIVSKSGRLVTKKLYTNVNPADLMSIVGYEFVEHRLKRDGPQ